MNEKSSRGLKIFAIIFMGGTAAMNVLGGSGTVCAAFIKTYFYAFKPLYDADIVWLYQVLMITTILTGIAGIWATVKMIRGGKKVFEWALIILVIGTILGGTQFITSMNVLGKATPANVKFFTNVATLLLFLVLRFTALKDKVDFSKATGKADNNMAGGLSAFVSGLIVLSVFIWAGPSHTYMGENWVELYSGPIMFSGALMMLLGITLILRSFSFMAAESKTEILTKIT